MPQGLQVWDASASLILDTSTLVLKQVVVQEVVSTGSGSTGQITTNLPENSTVIPTGSISNSSGDNSAPDVTISGDKVNFRFNGGSSGTRGQVQVMAY